MNTPYETVDSFLDCVTVTPKDWAARLERIQEIADSYLSLEYVTKEEHEQLSQRLTAVRKDVRRQELAIAAGYRDGFQVYYKRCYGAR